MKYLRLYTDDSGESRFEDLEFTFEPRDFAPPAPPIYVSEPAVASAFMMLRFPAGWTDPAHPAPARQFMVIVSGLLESSAGGETRLVSTGDVVLLEDTTGRGHGTTALEDTVIAVARL